MNDVSFDTLARDAAGTFSRRVSLGSLSVATLAALAGPLVASARKKGKKKRNGSGNINRKADQKCKQQKQQCFDFLEPFCAGDEQCAVDAIRCCPLAGECDVNGFFLCLEED
jgi:hypothetical protein